MSVQLRTVAVTATLTVDVTRNATGTLEDGAEQQLAGADRVRAVQELSITGVTPRLNDLQAGVETEVEVAVEPDADDRAAAAREALEDAFGVTVETVDVG